MKSDAGCYLLDLGQILRGRLIEAEGRIESASDSERQFELGRYRAYREVLALMLSQADAFGMLPSDLSLQEIGRDKDLGC